MVYEDSQPEQNACMRGECLAQSWEVVSHSSTQPTRDLITPKPLLSSTSVGAATWTQWVREVSVLWASWNGAEHFSGGPSSSSGVLGQAWLVVGHLLWLPCPHGSRDAASSHDIRLLPS